MFRTLIRNAFVHNIWSPSYICKNSTSVMSEINKIEKLGSFVLFVCVEVLRPSQQLRSCRAGQLPINTVPGQA